MVEVSIQSLHDAAGDLDRLAGRVRELPPLRTDWVGPLVSGAIGEAIADAGTVSAQAVKVLTQRLETLSRLLRDSAGGLIDTDVATSANLVNTVADRLGVLTAPRSSGDDVISA